MAAVPSYDDFELKERLGNGPLGILVTRVENKALLDDLIGFASKLDISVIVFFMDEAVKLINDTTWLELLPSNGRYSACQSSAELRSVVPHSRVEFAGQYHNALMVHDAPYLVSL